MPSGDFAAYVAAATAAIAEANQALERPLAAEVIEDRAPFELVPDPRRCPPSADGRHPKAALLLHGLGGTAYEMRDLGRALVQACYLVRAILLPGHGTMPGDLLDVDYQEWVQATGLAVASFERKAERLILVGFGVGATLALHEALYEEPRPGPELGGLVLLSPALGAAAPLAWLPAPGGYGDLLPALAGAGSCPTPTRCATSFCRTTPSRQRARLIADLDAQEGPLQLPVYVAISASDAEVDPAAARDWLCRRASGPRRLTWYTPGPAPARPECGAVVERASASAPGDPRSLPHRPADRPGQPALRRQERLPGLLALLLGGGHTELVHLHGSDEDGGELGGAPGRDHRGQPATPRRAAADLQPGFQGHGRRPAGVPGRPGQGTSLGRGQANP